MKLITFEIAKLAKKRKFQKFATSSEVNGEFFFYNRYGELFSNYHDKKSQSGNKSNAMLNDPKIGAIYSDSCEAVYQTELQTWIRDKHKIFVSVECEPYSPDVPKYYAIVKSLNSKNMGETLLDGFSLFEKYEDALEQGLQEALKLINQ